MGFNTFPCNPYPISTEELNKGNNDDLNTRVAALESYASDLNSNKANQITIAPFFNAETAYDPGDIVYYNGLSYRCVNAHEGEWDADDFAATTISEELDTLKNGLINKVEMKTTQDLNSANTTGVYFFAYNAQNVPSSHSGTVLTLTDVSGVTGMQIARVTTENTVYVRFCDNSTWTAWKQLAFTA